MPNVKLIAAFTLAFSLACTGGGGSTGTGAGAGAGISSTTLAPETDFFGITLGQAMDNVLAGVPPDAERIESEGAIVLNIHKDWEGRPWNLKVVLRDSQVITLGLSTAKDTGGPLQGVRRWAQEICDKFVPGGAKAVLWDGDPNRRFVQRLEDTVEAGPTGLGCNASDATTRRWAIVASDMVLAVVSRDATSKVAGIWSQLDGASTPFQWGEQPHVDDPIKLGDFSYTITSVTEAQQAGTNPYMTAKASDGAYFVKVMYTIENVGMQTATVLAGDLTIKDSAGRTFSPSSNATSYVAADEAIDILVTELQPGIPRKQVAVFEVPESEKRLDLIIPEKGLLGSAQAVIPLSFVTIDPGP